MTRGHDFADQYLEHLAVTQQAYAERRLNDYLAGFSDHYYSVQLHTQWGEDKAALASKIARDMERFELLHMSFSVLRAWFIGERGYAHLQYESRLKLRSSGRVLLDRRENLLLGEHLGAGRWLIDSKIVLLAHNHYEDDQPDL